MMKDNTISRKTHNISGSGNRPSVLGGDRDLDRTDRLSGPLTLLLQYMYVLIRVNKAIQLILHRYFVWIPSNLYPVSQAIHQNSNFRKETMLDLCDTRASNLSPVCLKQSMKTVIFRK